jgi:hypothetical protein
VLESPASGLNGSAHLVSSSNRCMSSMKRLTILERIGLVNTHSLKVRPNSVMLRGSDLMLISNSKLTTYLKLWRWRTRLLIKNCKVKSIQLVPWAQEALSPINLKAEAINLPKCSLLLHKKWSQKGLSPSLDFSLTRTSLRKCNMFPSPSAQ